MTGKLELATAPARPPIEDHAAQSAATIRIERDLDHHGWFDSVSAANVEDATAALAGLSGVDAAKVIDRLQADGQLDAFTASSVQGQDNWFGRVGLTHTGEQQFLGTLAGKLDGAHLATLSRSYAHAGDDHQQVLATEIARAAAPEAKLAFVYANARIPAGTKAGDRDAFYQTGDAQSAATVIASLRGAFVADAFGKLTAPQIDSVFAAASNVTTTTITGEGTSQTLADVHPEDFARLMAAVQSVPDSARSGQRSALIEAAAASVETVGATDGVKGWQTAPLASSVLGALDARSLAALGPQRAAALAAFAVQGEPSAVGQTVTAAARLDASPARDALIRTLFLKVYGAAYSDPQLRTAMGSAYARTQSNDPATIAALGKRYADRLGTDAGRELLADPKLNATARLWAMQQIAHDPAKLDAAAGGSTTPWETPALATLYAQTRADQYASARGNTAVMLSGGSDFVNFVGAGLGAPLRPDAPATQAGIEAAQASAARGNYTFYTGIDAVQKPADGMREAQRQLGGSPVGVSVLPVQFTSQATGPVELQLYRVENSQGSRYVDNTGRVYADFNAWKTENKLPPGIETYPADGEAGSTRLESHNTPDTSDTFWKKARDVADVAALVGGVVASGVLIFGSGGLATPLVAGAWTVAIGSAAYMGTRAAGDLADRNAHGQSIALSDPDARAAWISLAASGLTVAGAGVAKLGALAAEGSDLATFGARAAGVLNTSANYADAASTANTAASMVQNWDQLSPAERAQMGLQIAFWGGMTGLSAKAGGGALTDAFNFRAQINHAMLQTGAATRVNTALEPGDASVVATRGPNGGVAGIEVQYGPGTAKVVIDAHIAVAREMVTNTSAGSVMQRAFGSDHAFAPGSRGEEVSLEVAKHQMLVDAYGKQLADPALTVADRVALSRAQEDARFELSAYRNDLEAIQADPTLGSQPGLGSVDVKQSAQHWLDPAGVIPRDATARTDFSQLRTAIARNYPGVKPVTLNAAGQLTLADKTTIRNFGDRTNTLQRFLQPVGAGGYGGQVFYDAASNTVIAAVNMRTAANPNVVSRVEVPFTRNAAGEWRADFRQYAAYQTAIDPKLVPNRAEHFKAANAKLAAALDADPGMAGRLGLSADQVTAVKAGKGVSPAPYTWHHVDGGGGIWLVDSALHGLFLHVGGFSEWSPTGTLKAKP